MTNSNTAPLAMTDDYRDESILSWLRNLRGTGGCNAAAIEHIEEMYARIAAASAQAAIAWQVRRADGRIDGAPVQWENCTKDLYDATLSTGRYAGYENGPRCEVRALGVISSPASDSDVRRKALEEAAQACEQVAASRNVAEMAVGARLCVDAIRALYAQQAKD